MIPSGLSTMTAMFYRELEGKTDSPAITRLSAVLRTAGYNCWSASKTAPSKHVNEPQDKSESVTTNCIRLQESKGFSEIIKGERQAVHPPTNETDNANT